eukprot:m.807476 g.807476  ORF g.807476 m.807476 type:complete len:306 (+) comp59304_c0_seq4:370-1287(+)
MTGEHCAPGTMANHHKSACGSGRCACTCSLRLWRNFSSVSSCSFPSGNSLAHSSLMCWVVCLQMPSSSSPCSSSRSSSTPSGSGLWTASFKKRTPPRRAKLATPVWKHLRSTSWISSTARGTLMRIRTTRSSNSRAPLFVEKVCTSSSSGLPCCKRPLDVGRSALLAAASVAAEARTSELMDANHVLSIAPSQQLSAPGIRQGLLELLLKPASTLARSLVDLALGVVVDHGIDEDQQHFRHQQLEGGYGSLAQVPLNFLQAGREENCLKVVLFVRIDGLDKERGIFVNAEPRHQFSLRSVRNSHV